MDNIPWTERYRPNSGELLVGNNEARNQLKKWIESWKKTIPSKRAVLIIGPPGVGKTAAVYAIANDNNMEIVEFNASDKRSKDIIESVVWRAATQETLDGRKRIILLDEVDGLSGIGDRGGLGAIAKVIVQSVHPIIMTANKPENPRLKELSKVSITLTFGPIAHEEVIMVLKRILKKVSCRLEEEQIGRIVDKAKGDLRAAISDLELAVTSNIDIQPELQGRNTRRSIEQTLRRIFMTRDSSIAKEILSEADSDHDEIILWLEENLYLQLNKSEELEKGYEAISLSDLILGRIMKHQSWKLLSYFYDYISTDLVNSRTRTPFKRVKYNRPTWPLLVWKGQRQNDRKTTYYSRLSVEANVSKYRVTRTHGQVINYILKQNPMFVTAVAKWLNIKPEEVYHRQSRKAH